MVSRYKLPKYHLIGANIPRVDANAKVTGDAIYIEDIKLPNMLYGRILRSPYPHAKILNIDTSRAKSHAGVKKVITAQDLPRILFGMFPMSADQYPLAMDKVRHYMEGIAAVAAVDEDTAEEALQKIVVEYEPLKPIFNPEEAIKPGASLIHDLHKNNISLRITKTVGNIDEGFKISDYIREDTFRTAPQNQAAIEPHGCISRWELDGSLIHWSTTQAPFLLQRGLAKMMGLDMDRVRVITTIVGGGFGGKSEMYPHNIISAHLSRITGKPVIIMLSREEVFHATVQRHPMILTLRTGVKKDGTLICQDLKIIADGGAYAGTGPMALTTARTSLLLPYRLQSYHYDAIRALTNKPIGGPYQGHGGPQAHFAIESQLDIIAEELRLDPLDIRIKNFVYVGCDHPEKYSILSCGLNECSEFIEKSLNWRERKGKLSEGHGLGLAFSGSTSGMVFLPHAATGITIQINMGGGVNIFSGGADIGQGMDTVVCQVVAQELGIGMEDVRIITGDTASTPFDRGSYGTGGAMRLGNAALAAAKDVKKKLLEIIALKFETPPDNIEFGNGKIYVKGNSENGVDFKEAIKIYRYAGKSMPLVATGSYEPAIADINTLRREGGNISPTYCFMGTGFEVEVDKETGEVKILKAVIGDDTGRVINKAGQEGQMEGALSKGIGMAIYEDLPHENGKYINASFADYSLPTPLDEPREVNWANIETIDPCGPFGAKSAGEQVKTPVTPALANAIYDAVGVRMTELPITPEKILKALWQKEKGQL